jgi:hypothetical protein
LQDNKKAWNKKLIYALWADKVTTKNSISTLLMGLKFLDSKIGTKPATKAQLDSAAFDMEWFSRSCDLANLSMGFVFSCEGSPFR